MGMGMEGMNGVGMQLERDMERDLWGMSITPAPAPAPSVQARVGSTPAAAALSHREWVEDRKRGDRWRARQKGGAIEMEEAGSASASGSESGSAYED
jgi:hypothetical protein